MEDSFIVGKKLHLTKSGGLRSWKALDFKKWGGLEPRSLTEVYAYEYHSSRAGVPNAILLYSGPRLIASWVARIRAWGLSPHFFPE